MLFSPRLRDIVRIGVRRVLRQRRRYLGPASAVLLGIAGMVLVMSLSGDVKAEFGEALDLLGGATIVQLLHEQQPLDAPWSARHRFFTVDVARELRKLPQVATVSLVAICRRPVTAGWGKRRGQFPLIAVDHHFWDLHRFSALSGVAFAEQQVEDGERVCVVGADVARSVFNTVDVVGHPLQIEKDIYRIIGVLGNDLLVGEASGFVILPVTTALTRVADVTPPVRVLVRFRTWEVVEESLPVVEGIVGDYLSVDRLRIDVSWIVLGRVKVVARWVEIFANVCVASTLLLGGVGIWNAMMLSVSARTREIGVKRAVGAEDRDILGQILVESLALCMATSLPGVVLGGSLVVAVSVVLGNAPPLDLFVRAAGLSVALSVALGLAAGFFPAARASRMDTAAALRHE